MSYQDKNHHSQLLNIDYNSFRMNEDSILFSLLENTDQYKNCNTSIYSLMKKYEFNSSELLDDNSSFSSSFSSSSQSSDTNSENSDDNDNINEYFTNSKNSNKTNELEESNYDSSNEKKRDYTEEDKRKDIFRLNRQFTNKLKQLNIQLNDAYNVWKEKEKNGEEYEEFHLKWSYLNERYRIQKRKASREIYKKVQELYKRIYPSTHIHDLHGQGIKSGSFLYIVKKIIRKHQNEDKKNNDEIDEKKNNEIVFDLGDKCDGDWHLRALLIMISFLQEKGYNYHIDDNKRFVSVYL